MIPDPFPSVVLRENESCHMVEREMIKREITPLAVGFLIMISLFAYHWFNDNFKYAKNADRTIAKAEAELLHEVYLRTRMYTEHNQGIPDSLEDLLFVTAPHGMNYLQKYLGLKNRPYQIIFYPEHIQSGYPEPGIIIATEPDPNNLNNIRVLFYDGRVESHEKNEVNQRIQLFKD